MNDYYVIKDKHIQTKGELVQYEQFLNVLQCFQKSSAREASESFPFECADIICDDVSV